MVALRLAASWLCRILFPIRGARDYTYSYRADVTNALVDRYGSEFISKRGFSCMLDILLRLSECNRVASEVPQVLQLFFHSFVSKMGRVSLVVCCRTNSDMETGFKAFKASMMKSIQIEKHRFGVEREIVPKLAHTVASHEQQRDVAQRGGLPA